jgi:hypothetical protein
MKKNLSNGFKIENYKLLGGNGEHTSIVIIGHKMSPPSKRITLRQKDIKVSSAKIICKHKKGDVDFNVRRINHIKSFGEVRLHTNTILYPGAYEVTIEYTGKLDEKSLKNTPAN